MFIRYMKSLSITSRFRSLGASGLYTSGYALVINTAGTTVIGFIYWPVAAHLYTPSALGRSSALISALLLVSGIAQLNLNNTLPRFLPLVARRSGRLIRYTYGAAALATLLLGLSFVGILPRLNSQWRFLADQPALALAFVATTIVWSVFALEDAALTGLRRAVVVPVENVAYSIIKIAMLIALAAAFPMTGIFVSWTMPLLVIVPVINWLIFGRYLRSRAAAKAAATVRPREVLRYASIDFAGAMLGKLYGNALPLLVLSMLGARANSTFYVAWILTSSLGLVANNFATSMLVEGTSSPHRIAELTRGVLVRCALILVPSALALIAGSHLILSIYGTQYAAASSTVLRWLAISLIPRGIIVVVFAIDRLTGRVSRATFTNFFLTIAIFAGSWILLAHDGVNGVALAWGGANLLVAIVRLPTIIEAITGRLDRKATGADPLAASSPRPAPSMLGLPIRRRLRLASYAGAHRKVANPVSPDTGSVSDPGSRDTTDEV